MQFDPDKPTAPMTALVVRDEDWPEFLELREKLRALLKKELDPVWAFVHQAEHPKISFQGCEVFMKSALAKL